MKTKRKMIVISIVFKTINNPNKTVNLLIIFVLSALILRSSIYFHSWFFLKCLADYCIREKEGNCYDLTFCLFLVPRAPLPLVLRLEPPLPKTRTVRWNDATTVRVVAGSSSIQCQECKMEILGKTNTFTIFLINSNGWL